MAVARHLNEQSFLLIAGLPTPVSVEMIGQCVLIGVICAFASILLMLAIASADRTFQHLKFLRECCAP